MHDHEGPSEGHLQVSDRRHFTAEGERRPGIQPEEGREAAHEVGSAAAKAAPGGAAEPARADAPAPPASPPPPPQPAAGPQPPEPPQERLAAREITFAGLLQDLYATGMMQLGAEFQPGQPGQLDLEGARETIDLIGLLQQKTHGNLDAQESRLIETVLYELRLAYVQVLKASTSRIATPPRAVAPPPPRRR